MENNKNNQNNQNVNTKKDEQTNASNVLKDAYSSFLEKFNINIEDLTKQIITDIDKSTEELTPEESTKKIFSSIQEKASAITNKMLDDLLSNKDETNIHNDNVKSSSKSDKKDENKDNKIIEN